MLDKVARDGLMFGVSVGPVSNSLQVTQLLFADNTLVLCDAELGQILLLRLVFFWIEVVSGLKIIMGKLELAPVGVVPNIANFIDVLG